MSADRRTARDRRRRELGQNFLRGDLADPLIAEAHIEPGELVVDIGAGAGALTFACARRGARVVALEVDPAWASHLRARVDCLLDEPEVALHRADLIVQAEVAAKRAAVLTIRRRSPPLLPTAMARRYAAFVRESWPFGIGVPHSGTAVRR